MIRIRMIRIRMLRVIMIIWVYSGLFGFMRGILRFIRVRVY